MIAFRQVINYGTLRVVTIGFAKLKNQSNIQESESTTREALITIYLLYLKTAKNIFSQARGLDCAQTGVFLRLLHKLLVCKTFFKKRKNYRLRL